MVKQGLSPEEAAARFYVLDHHGLITQKVCPCQAGIGVISTWPSHELGACYAGVDGVDVAPSSAGIGKVVPLACHDCWQRYCALHKPGRPQRPEQRVHLLTGP